MPVKNNFPVFHKLKSAAYSYIWTDKCERLLPKHYKSRCLEFMMKEPTPVHFIPDTRKYYYDDHGSRKPMQNHPPPVQYPVQCNKGLWGGEGVIICYIKKIRDPVKDRYVQKLPRVYPPFLVQRSLYSEILDKWYSLPCTNRVMDMIDDCYGLDTYILKTHERDLNSKIGMDIKRAMLVALAKGEVWQNDPKKKAWVLKKYGDHIIPLCKRCGCYVSNIATDLGLHCRLCLKLEEAEWIGLSIKEALEKAEKDAAEVRTPLKYIIEEKFIQDLKDMKRQSEEAKALEAAEATKAKEQQQSKDEGTPV